MSPFGKRTWEDVRRVTFHRLRQQFPGVPLDDVEDAVGYAMLDLIDYWTSLGSSIDLTRPERTFWFAVRRARWMSAQFLSQEISERSNRESLDEMFEHGTEPVEAESDPEVIHISKEERELVFGLVYDLSDEQAGWLKSFLQGRSSRDEAASRGMSQTTASRRTREVLAELRTRAVEAGLL